VEEVAPLLDQDVGVEARKQLAQAVWDHCKVEGRFTRFGEDWAKIVKRYPYWEDEFIGFSKAGIIMRIQEAGVKDTVALTIGVMIFDLLELKTLFPDHLSWPQVRNPEPINTAPIAAPRKAVLMASLEVVPAAQSKSKRHGRDKLSVSAATA